jgi:hypothetical protein
VTKTCWRAKATKDVRSSLIRAAIAIPHREAREACQQAPPRFPMPIF